LPQQAHLLLPAQLAQVLDLQQAPSLPANTLGLFLPYSWRFSQHSYNLEYNFIDVLFYGPCKSFFLSRPSRTLCCNDSYGHVHIYQHDIFQFYLISDGAPLSPPESWWCTGYVRICLCFRFKPPQCFWECPVVAALQLQWTSSGSSVRHVFMLLRSQWALMDTVQPTCSWCFLQQYVSIKSLMLNQMVNLSCAV
jgi:hypothetical protein